MAISREILVIDALIAIVLCVHRVHRVSYVLILRICIILVAWQSVLGGPMRLWRVLVVLAVVVSIIYVCHVFNLATNVPIQHIAYLARSDICHR